MKEISEKYVEAKNVLSDIVLSFKGDLQRQEDEVQSLSQKVEDMPLRDDDSKKIEELRVEVMHTKNELREVSSMGNRLTANVEKLSKSIDDLIIQQKENVKKISELEEERRHVEPLISDRLETAIPIRRERALARLTETELMVLEILANEGEKTASQIKDKINLTREHTARLMKSLHSRGYVERATEKLPYMYRIKGEMMRILKKNGNSVG